MLFALPTRRHLRRIAVIRLLPAINKADFILAGLETFSSTNIIIIGTHWQIVAASCVQRHSKEVNPARHARNSPPQRHRYPLAAPGFEFSFQAAPHLGLIPPQTSTIEQQAVGAVVMEGNDEWNSFRAFPNSPGC